MKKTTFLTVLLMLPSVCKGYNMNQIKNYQYGYNLGSQKYDKETIDSVHGNGSVILEGTHVRGLVIVNGSLSAEEAVIGELQVNGQVEMKNCVVNKTSFINGSLNADNTKFQDELSVAAQKIVLRSCLMNALTLREVGGYDGVQVIDLRSGSRVNGPITVESGNGEVWLSSGSEISHEIVGAKVIKK